MNMFTPLTVVTILNVVTCITSVNVSTLGIEVKSVKTWPLGDRDSSDSIYSIDSGEISEICDSSAIFFFFFLLDVFQT